MFQTTNQFNLVMFHSYSYQKVSRLVNVPYMEHTYIYIHITEITEHGVTYDCI